jgi:hypothetical protein
MHEWLKCAAEAMGTGGTLFILFHLFTHEIPFLCLGAFGAFKLFTRGETCTKEHK